MPFSSNHVSCSCAKTFSRPCSFFPDGTRYRGFPPAFQFSASRFAGTRPAPRAQPMTPVPHVLLFPRITCPLGDNAASPSSKPATCPALVVQILRRVKLDFCVCSISVQFLAPILRISSTVLEASIQIIVLHTHFIKLGDRGLPQVLMGRRCRSQRSVKF